MASLRKSLFFLAALFCSVQTQTSNRRCYSPTRQCTTWLAPEVRDCTCGKQYLDYECHCQNDITYFETTLHQVIHGCTFECSNGGTLVSRPDGYFECDCRPGYYGFCCERETPLCGKFLLEPQGTFKSPNFGTNRPYPNNRQCIWKIATATGKRIALGVKNGAFSVEEGSSINTCDRDYITVYDGDSKNSRKIGPFCGNSSRPFQTIHSTGRHLYVEFRSNNKTGYAGFQLEYTTYREGLRCGPRREYGLPTAIITSPQYPLTHKPQERCEYVILVKPGHELILTTLHMNLPSSADCSQGDVIEVMRRTNSSREYQRITRLCGRENYAPYTIRNSSHVLLKFHSGFVNEGQFKLRYEQIPTPYFS